jgi:hypothetical protein
VAGGPVALRRRLAGSRKRARRSRHLPSRLNYTLRGPAKLVGVSMSWKLRRRLRSSARPPLRLEFLEERIQPGKTIGLGLAALFLGDAFDQFIASQRADRGRPSSAGPVSFLETPVAVAPAWWGPPPTPAWAPSLRTPSRKPSWPHSCSKPAAGSLPDRWIPAFLGSLVCFREMARSVGSGGPHRWHEP